MNKIIGAAIIIGLPFPAACITLKLLRYCTMFSGIFSGLICMRINKQTSPND